MMKKVYVIMYRIKRLNPDGKTYKEVSKLSQEGYSTLKEAQNFCVNTRGAREIDPFWYIVSPSTCAGEIKEYKIYEIEVR